MKYKQPKLAVDIIIKYKNKIVLIKRKNPPFGWALPGGFVEYNESLEKAAIREAKEETNLDVALNKQLHAYSDPKRDPRFHTISVVYIAEGKGKLKAKDDAKHVELFDIRNLPELVFDHNQIINDALPYIENGQ
jgi:ADP-ribose pyrophosphatase YjhB (NUDIX family)